MLTCLLIAIFTEDFMSKESQSTSEQYYKLSPQEIARDINETFCEAEPKSIKILDVDFLVCPHVYPSQRFRSTHAMLEAILLHTQNKKICEIGCGCGTLGQVALVKGAKELVQGDINPYAVKNALENKKLHRFSDQQLRVFESDCFDNIPSEIFDIIIFAMPYHNDDIKIVDPLLRAFYDPNFNSIKKFLAQAFKFCHKDTEIFIAFSNKGDTKELASIFTKSPFAWELYRQTNKDSAYDNRVYKLKVK